jgi:long-chain acyl-CoA synthetase
VTKRATFDLPPTIGHVLVPALNCAPNAVAVITRSAAITYTELDELANQAARAWQELGVRPGDRVAACLPNEVDIVIAFHGAMRLGAVWVGINQALAAAEKAHILRDSGAAALLCAETTADELIATRHDLPELRSITTVDAIASSRWASWTAALDAHQPEAIGRTIDPLAPAAIAYTSGTTGHPKGAVHSQRNLLLPGTYLIATRHYDETLRKGDSFPLTILNLMVLTTLLTAQANATAIIMDTLSARAIAEWIGREEVSVWNGPPALLYTMCHDPAIAPRDLQSLTEVWSGGADCPEPIRTAFEAKFGIPVRATYGMTEAPTVVSIESPQHRHVPGSSGKPLPHLEVTIRDPGGTIVAAGEVGEICVGTRTASAIRSSLQADCPRELALREQAPTYTPMLGYWGKDEEGHEALRGGVLHTGDVGSLDADGNLIVSDRISLVLNRGGANVYPAEVERVVLGRPEVEACGVFGLPDERLGQQVAMLLQFKSGCVPQIEPVIEYCRRELARYKIPERIAAVESLPRNAMGKLDRRALAQVGERLLAGS